MTNDVLGDRRPIAAVLWPARGIALADAIRAVVLIALGIALLALSAKTSVPLPMVPMTLQTLVVLVIGAAYGWRLGAATVIAYLAVGAAGLAVFAGPAGGSGRCSARPRDSCSASWPAPASRAGSVNAAGTARSSGCSSRWRSGMS